MTYIRLFYIIFTISIFHAPLGASHQVDDAKKGFYIINNGKRAVSFAWYKTKIARSKISFQEYAWGEKLRMHEPTILAPLSKSFISTPETASWNTYKTEPELLLSFDTGRLIGTIGVTANGTIASDLLKNLYICKTANLPAQKTAAQATHLMIEQPAGTSYLQVGKVDGWYFENKAKRPVYARWLGAPWNYDLKKYDTPILLTDYSSIEIQPGQMVLVPHIKSLPVALQPQLLFSFNRQSLEAAPTQVDETISKLRGSDLGPAFSVRHIFDEQSVPVFVYHSRILTINNATNKTIYCAMYYVDDSGALKFGATDLVTVIRPQMRQSIHYPDAQTGKEIQLALAASSELLKKSRLTPEQMKEVTFHSFANNSLFEWYFQGEYNVLIDATRPHAISISTVGNGMLSHVFKKTGDIGTIQGALSEDFENKLAGGHALYQPDAEILSARTPVLTNSAQLTQEHAFIAKRSKNVRHALNKFLAEDVFKNEDPIVTIALVFTGGGYRAMIETIGFLKGAAQPQGGNLFDCALMMAGLSGSTWAINPLVLSGLAPAGFCKQQRTKFAKPNSLNTLVSAVLNNNPSYLERRFIQGKYGQYHGLSGIYGHALSDMLLGEYPLNNKTCHHITLSDLREQLGQGQYPLPISVAIDPGSTDSERLWYEFSPYYIGTHQEQGSWVDTKLFGCTFKNGEVLHYVPEYPLAHYMGLWGSAFAVTAQDIEKDSPVAGFLYRAAQQVLNGLVNSSNTPGQDRLGAAQIPNFTYGHENALPRLSKHPIVCLVDGAISKEAGYRHNFASIPALWRKIDVLIMCDCAMNPNTDYENEHLMASDEEARRLRLPFPNLKRSSLHKKTLDAVQESVCSCFVEEGAPIVVYMKAKKNALYDEKLKATRTDPFTANSGFDPDATVSPFTRTMNFSYTQDQFDLLSGLTESIMIQAKDTIKQAIKHAIKRKQVA